MKVTTGWLTFLLAVAFGAALFFTMIGATWYGLENQNALIGYFGFGIPMILAGAATAGLWHDKKPFPLNVLGWTCAAFGLGHGLCILILVVGIVFPTFGIANQTAHPAGAETSSSSDTSSPSGPLDRMSVERIAEFVGFGLAMFVCGGAGIGILNEADKK